MMLENKEITIENLKNNINLFSEDSKSSTLTSSAKQRYETEVKRLMNENEDLRDKLVEMQREFEEKESELINEINKLVVELNEGQGEGGDQEQDDEN